MIPATYPSILDSSNRTKMLVYQVPSITGLTRWVDYIPVKSPASESDLTLANTYANEGFILTSKVNDITGLVPFKDYVPIYLDSTATKAWSADNDGYIPMAELAGLLLDFTTGALDPRIAFTRATNATVTNSAGLITYAPHNLLTYSEQFDNTAWVKGDVTVTANSIASPDRTVNADTVTATTSVNGVIRQVFTASGASYTFSVWLKRKTGTGDIRISAGGAYTTVVVTSEWQRFEITQAPASGSRTTGFFVTVSGDEVYAWGAQLEIGSTATTYNSTTVKNLLGYSELFDNNAAWTKSNSFVQTNSLTFSEAFDNAAWSKAETTILANNTIAPNGYQTADKIVETATTSLHYTQRFDFLTALSPSTSYTLSVYAKAAERNIIFIGADNNAFCGAYFNLTTGQYIQSQNTISAYSIIPVGNGWYRLSVTFLSSSTGKGNAAFIPTTVVPYASYAGDGTSGLFLWGAQLVQGSVAGDYRRTDAAALPVYYPNHNGVVCAERIVPDSANVGSHRISQTSPTVTGGIYTYSIYAKADGYSWLKLCLNTIYANFNLSTGVTGVTNGTSSSIQSLGNGWYRCSVTKTATGNNELAYAYVANSNNAGLDSDSFAGDGTSGIYIFGAQLSDSASLDPYVLNAAAAPTAAAYYGARFDYDPVTLLAKGLLIEEQRNNLCVYSGDTSNANWAGTNVIKTSTNNLAPDGSSTALLATASGGTTTHTIGASVTATVSYTLGATYTISCFVKEGTTNRIQLSGTGTGFGGGQYANFLLSGSGSVTGSAGGTASIQQFNNGWYRIIFTIVASATAAGSAGVLAFITSGTDTRFPTNASTDNIYMWGFQTEAGAFATSYIPTVASQVTRSADSASMTGTNFSSWYRADASTFYYDFADGNVSSHGGNAPYDTLIGAVTNGVRSGSQNSLVFISGWKARSRFTPDLSASIINTGGAYHTTTISSTLKIATFLDQTAMGGSGNGGSVVTTSFTVPPSYPPNMLYINERLNGHIRKIAYYPQRLSNDVLKGLTA